MSYAFVTVATAPVRRKARHQSEMVNQLLFGESVKVLKQKDKLWVKVRSLHDGYEGWMTNTLLTETTEKLASASNPFITAGPFTATWMDDRKFFIPLGSVLPNFVGKSGSIGGKSFRIETEAINREEQEYNDERLIQFTSSWLNVPYLWGGRTIFGVDCSGFVQVNFRLLGIDLPRDAWQQAGSGVKVKKLEHAICGDLAFFDDKDEIVHVGILLGNGRIIHASGKVRLDSIDKQGIIHSETGERTHSLKVIRRVTGD